MSRSDRASSAEPGPKGVVPCPSRGNPDSGLFGLLEGRLAGSVSDGDEPVVHSIDANGSGMGGHQRMGTSHAITFNPRVTTCALNEQTAPFELLLCLERHLVGRGNKTGPQDSGSTRLQRRMIDHSRQQLAGVRQTLQGSDTVSSINLHASTRLVLERRRERSSNSSGLSFRPSIMLRNAVSALTTP